MDIENLKSWATQPDVCRCCLSTSGTWNMLSAYLNEAGEKQVYSEILYSCFGISMSFFSELAVGQLMCDLCMTRLLEADTFKKQVLYAEEQFVSYISSRQEAIEETEKIEEIFSVDLPNEDIEHTEASNAEEISTNPSNDHKRTDAELEHKSILNKSRSRRKTKHVCRESISSEDQDCDNIPKTVPQLKPSKLVSERKRIKVTCEAILRDTTACAFRHHRSWFQCFFCANSFIEISALRLHTDQAHKNMDEEIKKLKRYPRSLQIDITELKCRLCNLDLASVDSMKVHLDSHGLVIYKECIADYKVNCSPYSCHLCGKQFHVFRTLTTHLNEHYANYICDICGKSFINSKRLKVHNRTHESGVFPCSQCGKVLKTKASKANHMESHSKRVIRCQICTKPMKHYNDRIKHMSEEHNITHKFKCHICSREYNIKHYLATHIRQTHGHKNKKCAECDMAFITNHGLKKHMQKHSGAKTHSCEICHKAYARSYSLREHMRIHNA